MTDAIVIQLTDLHLPQNPRDLFRGISVADRLSAIIDEVRKRFAGVDQLLLTGDLTHHGDMETYRWLQDQVTGIAAQTHWIPGNHDLPDLMQGPLSEPSVRLPGWQIIMLDSTSEPDGRGSGSLSQHELQTLATRLAGSQAPTLIALHHNPIATGSGWQDPIMLGNADAFWRIVEEAPQVRAVLHGHIHHHYDQYRDTVRVLGTPAIAPQFKAQQDDFQLEDDPALIGPAFRWLKLSSVGELDTGIVQL